MGRNTERKLATDPNMVHVEAKRDSTGAVQMTAHGTPSFSGVDAAGTTAVTTIHDLVAFTSATLKVTSTSGSPTTANLLRDGSAITSVTGGITPNSTVSTSATHFTALNGPVYSVQAVGGTITGTVSVSMEDRV